VTKDRRRRYKKKVKVDSVVVGVGRQGCREGSSVVCDTEEAVPRERTTEEEERVDNGDRKDGVADDADVTTK
jgi:hypothetical protein